MTMDSSRTAEPEGPRTASIRTPADFLKLVIGHPVIVKLHSGIDYKGTAALVVSDRPAVPTFLFSPRFSGVLVCLDGYMNIALEKAEEWAEGRCRQVHGDAFIRGNNGTSSRARHYY